jgi:hypothetical protein
VFVLLVEFENENNNNPKKQHKEQSESGRDVKIIYLFEQCEYGYLKVNYDWERGAGVWHVQVPSFSAPLCD